MTETRRPLANASTMLAVVCLTVGLVGTAMLLVPADWRPHFTVSLLCPSNIPQGQPLHITVLTAGRDGLNTKRDLTVEMALENRRDYRIVHQGQQVIPTSVHYELPTNELLPDRYLVRVSIDGIEPIESAFRVGDPPSAYAIRLQTDRPRYQPGQSIRVRSVVTKDGKPTGNEKVTLSIVDDKGTRLLGKELMTSSFGVAATEFNLASELRLGDYKVVAESSQGIKESLPVTIDRYVLPAFLVDLKLDKRGLGDSHYLINGIVSTRHPTAGPILDCTVEVSAWIRASRLFPKQSAKGRTDKRGEFAFTFDLDQLPRFASGNNDAVIELQVTATVTDPTGHSEEVSKSISIPPFKEPFQIFVIPEQGVLKQGIDNKVTLICCDSSGNPVQAEVVADSDAGSFSGRTSPFGAVTGSIRPDASDCQIRITGETAKQEKFEKTFDLVATSPEDRLALRFDRLEIPKDGNVTLRAKGLEVGADAVLEIRSFVSNRQLYAQHFTATKITEEFSLTAEDWPVGVVVAGLWQPSPAGAARLGEASALVAGESGLQTRLKLAASQVAPGEVNHLKIEATSVDGNPVRGVPASVSRMFGTQGRRLRKGSRGTACFRRCRDAIFQLTLRTCRRGCVESTPNLNLSVSQASFQRATLLPWSRFSMPLPPMWRRCGWKRNTTRKIRLSRGRKASGKRLHPERFSFWDWSYSSLASPGCFAYQTPESPSTPPSSKLS